MKVPYIVERTMLLCFVGGAVIGGTAGGMLASAGVIGAAFSIFFGTVTLDGHRAKTTKPPLPPTPSVEPPVEKPQAPEA